MVVWTYRRPFILRGEAYTVRIDAGFTGLRSRLMLGTRELARDESAVVGPAAKIRNHRLHHTLADGAQLEGFARSS